MLDLSNSPLNYVPPSVLFERTHLQVNLSGSPVFYFLDWSLHDSKVAKCLAISNGQGWQFLPDLTSLNLSGNELRINPTYNDFTLTALQRLRVLDLSDNPDLTPKLQRPLFLVETAFSASKAVNELGPVDLSNVGLSPMNVDLSMTRDSSLCEQLEWIRDMSEIQHSKSSLLFGRNSEVQKFFTLGKTSKGMKCHAIVQ